MAIIKAVPPTSATALPPLRRQRIGRQLIQQAREGVLRHGDPLLPDWPSLFWCGEMSTARDVYAPGSERTATSRAGIRFPLTQRPPCGCPVLHGRALRVVHRLLADRQVAPSA